MEAMFREYGNKGRILIQSEKTKVNYNDIEDNEGECRNEDCFCVLDEMKV